jgi:hypothetical protein
MFAGSIVWTPHKKTNKRNVLLHWRLRQLQRQQE